MTPDMFIASKASEAIKALYNTEVEPSTLQVGVTRKEFEGDYTLVVFPLLRTSRKGPEQRAGEIGAWLGPQMVEAYTRLHDLGLADSVEVWHGEKLVGGLYGVHMNGMFCGESMFSLEPGASKLALVSLARKMEAEGEKLIDCQLRTDHLASMGGRYIPYEEYMDILQRPFGH